MPVDEVKTIENAAVENKKTASSLIKIEAIVREDKYEDIIAALHAIEFKGSKINGFTVSQVMGCGSQRGHLEKVRAQDVFVSLRPKMKFEIVVSNQEWADIVIETIRNAALTGNHGDGKIFSYKVEYAMRIRTGEEGTYALNENENGKDA